MSSTPRAIRILLIALSAAVGAVYLTFGILTARQTLACDFLVYRGAAIDFLGGRPIYDLSIMQTGSCNLYYYPPPFVAAVVPFSVVDPGLGILAWIAFLTACFVGGCLAMPVRAEIRLAIFTLGVVSWPFIFGVRIGQTVPLLFLLFAIGWRYLDRPAITGAAMAVGTLVKIQPIVVIGWMAVRRMWKGLAASAVVVTGVSAAAAIVGLGGWGDMITVLGGLRNSIDHPANLALGAIGYQHGLNLQAASALQAIGALATLALVAFWGVRGSVEAGYLVAVIGSQLVSPIIWSHYALILLLPVAWLLQQRQWWAVLIPISQTWVLLPYASNDSYALAFYVALIAVPIVDWRRRRADIPLKAAASA